MNAEEQSVPDYQTLQIQFLTEAEDMFGPKTDYTFIGVFYHNYPPRMMHHDTDFLTGKHFFKIELHGKAIVDLKDGIFQLSHEVVHLLSPVPRNEDEGATYLEEGMAVYFSKLITDRETGDLEYSNAAIANDPKYLKAYELYLKLIEIDKDAVKKIRDSTPIIDQIQVEDFATAGLNVPEDLIRELLAAF